MVRESFKRDTADERSVYALHIVWFSSTLLPSPHLPSWLQMPCLTSSALLILTRSSLLCGKKPQPSTASITANGPKLRYPSSIVSTAQLEKVHACLESVVQRWRGESEQMAGLPFQTVRGYPRTRLLGYQWMVSISTRPFTTGHRSSTLSDSRDHARRVLPQERNRESMRILSQLQRTGFRFHMEFTPGMWSKNCFLSFVADRYAFIALVAFSRPITSR